MYYVLILVTELTLSIVNNQSGVKSYVSGLEIRIICQLNLPSRNKTWLA